MKRDIRLESKSKETRDEKRKKRLALLWCQ
jgi:hypothetical protein